jgi:hypothetical protein
MRARAAIVLLALVVISRAGAKQHCTFRLHTEANARDSEVFSTQLRSAFTGKQVVIEKVPAISEHDVVAFLPYPKGDGTFGALFQLDDHGRLALDTLSVERRGTALFVFVNGRPITELQIDRRIADGKVYIPSGLTAADIELMRKEWRVIGQRKK